MRSLLLAALLVLLVVPVGFAADQRTKEVREKLRKLSDAELIQQYAQSGLTLRGTPDAPTDEPIARAANASFGPPSAFELARAEILRRGEQMVPALLAFLKTEAVTRRPADRNELSVSFTGDVLRMLWRIGDARAVPLAIEILDGMNGQVGPHTRRIALDAVERLTYCAMHRVVPHHSNYADAVEHADAVREETFQDLGVAARMYRDWLTGEGKDPGQWFSLARSRARRLIAGDDPDAIYCAAVFLGQGKRDDDSAATLKRLADVIDAMKPGAEKYSFTYLGKSVSAPAGNWALLLSRYGPAARPYAKTLIRLQQANGDNSWSDYANLRKVGGLEILAHLFEMLPRINEEVAKIQADPKTPKGFSSSDPRLGWISSQREVQLAIDRWAGRLFKSDVERIAWWQKNKDRPPEAWLAENLETLVKQADAGETWGDWLAAELLPDLPKSERFRGTVPLEEEPEEQPVEVPSGPFREKWLREHKARLAYDSAAGVFHLKTDEKK
jgi:hypothetical protein